MELEKLKQEIAKHNEHCTDVVALRTMIHLVRKNLTDADFKEMSELCTKILDFDKKEMDRVRERAIDDLQISEHCSKQDAIFKLL